MIINIRLGNFGGPMRNGDLVALGNVAEYNKELYGDDTKLYVMPDAIHSADYCQKFYQFLLKHTDYFTETMGNNVLDWNNINLWDFRWSFGDNVKIKNDLQKQKKIVVCPLFDAPYNQYRNWTPKMFTQILEKYKKYSDYEKIICCASEINISNLNDWKISTDFMENIHHIMTAEMFAGGDTGTSHFVGALENGPMDIQYYYSGHGVLHTTPINVFNGKGKLNVYWKESETIL